MTRDQAKRHINLLYVHFIHSKDLSHMSPFKDRLETLIDKIYNDFNESQEGLRYTYEETITGLLTGAEDA